MKKLQLPPFLFIGLTLFSMFFGAGNLIFAPFMGAQAGTLAPMALLGFAITSVVMPIAAVIIISRFENARAMISTLNPVVAAVFMVLVYLLIGPCIAIPRTASTSFEMFGWLFGDSKIWQILYTLLFFGASFVTALRPGMLKDVLGKVMGPILVALVLILCSSALLSGSGQVALPVQDYANGPFWKGFNEGYQTMDILAAYCFGIVLSLNIDQLGIHSPKARRSLLWKASLVAGGLLAFLYGLLAFCGMKFSGDLSSMSNGAQILSWLASRQFGAFGSILISLIFLAACYNVCSGLLSCVSEFFADLVPSISYLKWLLLFTAAGIVVSVGGLDWILAFSGPILSGICPVAIALLVWGLFVSFRKKIR